MPTKRGGILNFDDERERTPLATVARRAGARDVNPPPAGTPKNREK